MFAKCSRHLHYSNIENKWSAAGGIVLNGFIGRGRMMDEERFPIQAEEHERELRTNK